MAEPLQGETKNLCPDREFMPQGGVFAQSPKTLVVGQKVSLGRVLVVGNTSTVKAAGA